MLSSISAHTSLFEDAPSESGGSEPHLVLIVANGRLPASHLLSLWTRSRLRVAADGGANRLFDLLPALLPGLPPEQASR